MAKKNNIGLGLAALAVGAGAVAAGTKGQKAEVKKEERGGVEGWGRVVVMMVSIWGWLDGWVGGA